MAKSRIKPSKAAKNQLLIDAQEAIFEFIEDNQHVDLSRVGMVWAGILDLEGPIPASEVAAMLGAYDLVRATTMVDSRKHWVNVAAFAALADAADVTVGTEMSEKLEAIANDKSPTVIGFAPSGKNDSQ
jgi:hypothetical protein